MYRPEICKHEWLQEHEEFLPHPFNILYKCLQCQRVLIGEPKVQGLETTAKGEAT